MTNFTTAQPNAPATQSATYPAQPSEFERQCRTRMALVDRLKELHGADDKAAAHLEADRLLCEYLEMIGARDLVEAYRAVPKWYE